MKLRTQPYPYQLECADEIDDFNGRALVAMPMGAGKSIMALLHLYRHPEIKHTVIVCPASVKYVWENECRKHLGLRVEILEGLAGDASGFRVDSRVFVLSYNVVHAWLPFLKGLDIQLVICDEAHLLQGHHTLRTKSVRELCEGVPRVLLLSGTPLTNRPSDLWPSLNILRPDIWNNWYRFAHTHCGARLIMPFKRWDFRGASKLPMLRKQLLRYCMIRRRKEDILDQLPPKTRHVIPLDISSRKEYDHAVKNFLSWLHTKSPVRANRAAKCEKIVKLGYLLRLAAEKKLPGAMEWIDNFLEDGGKLLLFGIHDKVLTTLEDRYKNICVRVDGSIVGRKRDKSFRQFNEVKKTRLMIANIKAAGVGWSCTSTSDVAFVEMAWSSGDMLQCEDRVSGIGRGLKGKQARSWFLVSHGTVEQYLCELLQKKQRIITSTLDGGKVQNDLNIYDQLAQELERGM